MATFEWTPRLEVGFPEMDLQHQGLIALMGRLNEQIDHDAPRTECLTTLSELGELSVRHFAEEEKVMEAVGFPRIDHHKLLHEMLLDRFAEFQAEARRPDGRLTPQFMDFLNGWLTGHIRGPDTQYGVYSGSLTRRAG